MHLLADTAGEDFGERPLRRRLGDSGVLFAVDALPQTPDWACDLAYIEQGLAPLAGVDEAGRGPLAGPVVAAAVVLPVGVELPGLRDSKLLTEAAREAIYPLVLDAAVDWSVCAVEPDEIDGCNILVATHRAMARALAGLRSPPRFAIVDGLPVRGLPCPHAALVKGDRRAVSIAAASVLAKVTRDRRMRQLDEQHPGYGLAEHKGYPTRAHMEALHRLGPAPCHRRTFGPVARMVADGLADARKQPDEEGRLGESDQGGE